MNAVLQKMRTNKLEWSSALTAHDLENLVSGGDGSCRLVNISSVKTCKTSNTPSFTKVCSCRYTIDGPSSTSASSSPCPPSAPAQDNGGQKLTHILTAVQDIAINDVLGLHMSTLHLQMLQTEPTVSKLFLPLLRSARSYRQYPD